MTDKRITVGELITTLSDLDHSYPVFVHGYEGGFNDILGRASPVMMKLNCNTEDYFGKHDTLDRQTDDPKEFEQVIGFILQ